MHKETNLLLLSVKDFFTPQMLKYSLAPFIVTVVLTYALFFYAAGVGLDQLGSMNVESSQTSIQNGVEHTENFEATLEGSAIIKFLMSHALTSWIATFLVYTVGGFLTLYLSIFVALLVIGFLTPFILKTLQKRHYPDVEMIGHSNALFSILSILKWTAIMIFLFILLVPLYFVPLINVIAFNFPLYYFFHKVMTFDVSSNVCTKEEDKKIKYFNANSLRLKTLALYLISLIPFAIFFGAVFYVIYIGHSYFVEVKKIRETVSV